MSKQIKKVSDLIPDSRNANKGTERGNAALEKSITKLGLGRSVLIDKNGVIIAGNKTVEKAVERGIENIVVIPSDGNTLIAVQRNDLDLKKDKRAKELAIADNRVAELDLEWDDDILRELSKEVDVEDYFNDKELVGLLALGEKGEAPEARIEEADELQKKWLTAPGQTWVIKGSAGNHRILCADITSDGALASLLGTERPAMAFTDPPYNVDFGAKHRHSGKHPHPTHRHRNITNDRLSDEDWKSFVDNWMARLIEVVDGGIYICMSDKELSSVTDSFKANGGHWSSYVIWVKDRLVLGMKDYHSRHETILYGWREGNSHFFVDDRTKTDVWEVARPSKSDLHPTMKPVELMTTALENSSRRGEIILDPFLGSGSTAVACELAGRLCYGMDIEPKYVAVTLERIAEMGLTPKLVK